MSIFCGKCGTANPNGATYCKKCGSPLEALETASFPDNSSFSQEGSAQMNTSGFFGNLKVLESDEPYPDKASKYKTLNFLVFSAVMIAALCIGGDVDLAQKLLYGFVGGLIMAGLCHLILVNVMAGAMALPMNYYKYWLPCPISDGELARKIAPPLRQLDLRVRLNSGITRGIFVGDDNIAYQIILHNEKRYFEVLFMGKVYLSTYECLIRDIPRIAYTIQQKLL